MSMKNVYKTAPIVHPGNQLYTSYYCNYDMQKWNVKFFKEGAALTENELIQKQGPKKMITKHLTAAYCQNLF